MRRSLLIVLLAVALLVTMGGAALAGEINGQGNPVPAADNSRSLCAFSGLEDEPHDPGVTQNWGQIIKMFGPLGGAANVTFLDPPEGCNANLYPNK